MKLLSIGEEFLSCERQPASSWLELLGVLASLIQLIPGGRLWMRSLQFCLRRSWDHSDQSVLVRWTPGGSGMVARSGSAGGRDFVRSSIPTARVLVRRIGCRLGSSSRGGAGFRPLVSKQTGAVHQRQRTSSYRESSVIFRSSGARLLNSSVCGQLHNDRLPSEPGRNAISTLELHSSEDSSSSGNPEGDVSSTIYNGSTQCAC